MESRNGTPGLNQVESFSTEIRRGNEVNNDQSSQSENVAGVMKEQSSDHEGHEKRRPTNTTVRDSDYPKRVHYSTLFYFFAD